MAEKLLKLLLLISLIATVVAINCYDCDNRRAKDCGEEFKPHPSGSTNCTSIQSQSDDKMPEGCVKQIYEVVNAISGKTETYFDRFCFFGDIKNTTEACALPKPMKLVSCDVCDNEDYCNHAAKLQTSSAHLSIGGIILVVKFFEKFLT